MASVHRGNQDAESRPREMLADVEPQELDDGDVGMSHKSRRVVEVPILTNMK